MEEGSLVGRNLHPWFVPPSDVDLRWLLWLLLALALGDALLTHNDPSYAAGFLFCFWRALAVDSIGFSGSCSFWLLLVALAFVHQPTQNL
eukprot:11427545-Ditylum_brightwellii.AAC.1